MDPKGEDGRGGAETVQDLTERAVRLWGPDRARAARANIAEAAEYVRIIAENPPPDEAAPLFHP